MPRLSASSRLLSLLVPASILLAPVSANAIEWGTAGVLSQQGQRLKVAVPFAASERISVVQFMVISSSATAGSNSPDPAEFTISKSPDTGMVFFQSSEPIYTSAIDLVIQVASDPGSAVRYQLRIPGQ